MVVEKQILVNQFAMEWGRYKSYVNVHLIEIILYRVIQEESKAYQKRGKLLMKKFNMPETETHKFILSNKDLRLMEVIGEGMYIQ